MPCPRLELQQLSGSTDGALSPILQPSPTWDYQAIFDQSENSPDSDIPHSTQVRYYDNTRGMGRQFSLIVLSVRWI